MGRGEDTDGQHDTFSRPLTLTPLTWTSSRLTEFLIRLDILYNYFVTGEDNKVVFSIPANTGIFATWAHSSLLENDKKIL